MKNITIDYQEIPLERICPELFAEFRRHQDVTRCWRKIDGNWCVKDIAFIDDWNEKDYGELVSCLRNTAKGGGAVFGAFCNGKLKGFASVEPERFGKNREYADLSSLHVSEELRGHGIGKSLFLLAKDWAKAHGAGKLYISGHSAVETQAFYHVMGCVEAEEVHPGHVEKEPCDCQLECTL